MRKTAIAFINEFALIKQHRREHRKVTTFDVTVFLRQLATLISAGVPIIQSCEVLEKSQEKQRLRRLIYNIRQHILKGNNLHISLRLYPNYFDSLTCHLVQIGEHTGKLELMLTTIANYQERKLAFRKKLQQALLYPSIIIITAFVVLFCMFVFVIPRFADLFHDMSGTLPLLTIGIFYVAAKCQQYVWLWLASTIISIAGICYAKGSMKIKQLLQRVSLHLPLIKSCLYKITLARFARQLAITLAAGIPITDALKLTANSSSDANFTQIIAELRSKISAGLPLHQAMRACHYFPTLMVHMVKIGEEAGMFEAMLHKTADFFEADIEETMSRLNQLLEPLIMLVLGVLIGVLVIGMYLPIFKLGSTI